MTTGTILRSGALVASSLLVLAMTPEAHARELQLDERVAAQTAMESVYWSHRIWPAQNPGPKPTLPAIMPGAAVRAKVEQDLRTSALLDEFWHEPLTGEALQAELDRMARETKAPGTLRELFAALHDDPDLIAECLARPSLAQRRVVSLYAGDERIHGSQRASLESRLAHVEDLASLARLDGEHVELRVLVDDGDAWDGLIGTLADGFHLAPGRSLAGIPVGRVSRLLDRGDRFVVLALRAKGAKSATVATVSWMKRGYAEWSRQAMPAAIGVGSIAPPPQGYVLPALPAGGCLDDAWATSSLTDASGFNVPAARQLHTAVWTGAEMIVWGGWDGTGVVYKTGGLYNPALDSWSQSSLTDGSGNSVPSARYGHSAVWTGTEMIVWGGLDTANAPLRNGGRYNPAGDSWVQCSLTDASGANVPAARELHTAIWTGTEMIVWGGNAGSGASALSTGGRYAPGTDTWATSKLTDGSGFYVPVARFEHTAVWSGTEMIIWGGLDGGGVGLNTGGRYDPAADLWGLSSIVNATGANVPSMRHLHSAVWTGTEMIVWGGAPAGAGAGVNNGGRYNPASDTWKSSSLVNASGAFVPSGRQRHTAVWTGSEMIVWGGSTTGSSSVLNTGGRYDPVLDTWASSSLTNATGANIPSSRQLHTAIWTGTGDSRMIVWGGSPNTATGGLYCAMCTPKTWYQDADGDGYGNPAVTQANCTRPPGYVTDATDCNDGNASIHPGAAEVCDGLDDNCDTVIDEGGAATCTDGDVCTTDVCGGVLGCLPAHKTSNLDTSSFSANRVDGLDLAVLAAAWTSTTGGPADLDQSNTVDDVDFHLFMTAFGRSCP